MYETQDYVVPLIWETNGSHSSPNVSARGAMYGVSGIPHAQFQGVNDVVGGGIDMLPSYTTQYNNFSVNDSPFQIDLSFDVLDGMINLSADVLVTGAVEATDINKLIFLVTYNYGDTYEHSVQRYAELDFDLTNIDDSGSYATAFEGDPSWDLAEIKAIALIQKTDGTTGNYPIHQGAISRFPFLPVAPLADFQINVSSEETYDLTNYFALNEIPVEADITVTSSNENLLLAEYADNTLTLTTGAVGGVSTLTITGAYDGYQSQDVVVVTIWNNNLVAAVDENFEGAVLPDGWQMTTNSAVGWTITNNGGSSYWAVPTGDGFYACSNDDAANDDGSVDYLVLPVQDLSVLSEAVLTFDYFYTAAYSQLAGIEISTDDGATWQEISALDAVDDWTEIMFPLSDYLGAEYNNALLAFHSNDGGVWASGFAVDNVQLLVGGAQEMGVISGTVTNAADSSPIADAVITAGMQNATTDENGQYTMQVVVGEYNVTCSAENYDAVTPVTVTIDADEIEIVDFALQLTGNDGDSSEAVSTNLTGNYPNPFNPTTAIAYSVAEESFVSIVIYNVTGQKVKTLVNNVVESGNHNVVWNGTTDEGTNVGSGMYFYKMKNGRYTSTKKMILIK